MYAIRYNRFEGWSEKHRRGKNSKPILVEGKHDAIIEKDLWDRVQALFQQKSKDTPPTYDGVSLLTGLIRCPQCGSPMVASRTVNYLKDGTRVVRRYYSCGAFRSKGSPVCRANSIGADYAERYVIGRIREVLTHLKVLRDIVRAVNAKRTGSVEPMRQELVALDRSLGQLAERKKKIMDVFEEDAIEREALVARLDELTVEEDALRTRRSEISIELGSDELRREGTFDEVHLLLERLDELLDISPLEMRKTLLHLVAREITVREGRQIDHITLSFDDKSRGSLTAQDPPAPREAGGSFCVTI